MNNFIKILENQQKRDGSFTPFSGADSTYFTAFVLSELNDLPQNKEILKIKQRSAVFLLSRKRTNFIFSNNILKNFLIISALFKYDAKIFDGNSLGKILKQLISLEQEVGGPYYNQDKEKLDLATNVQIAYFLSLHNVSLPKLNNFIEQAIITKNYNSCFYTSVFPTIYILSKFYSGEKKDLIIEFLLNSIENDDKTNFDYLFSALALKNLSSINKKIKDKVEFLQAGLTSDEFFKSLLVYQFLAPRESMNKKNDFESKKMEERIWNLVKKRFVDLSLDIKEIAEAEIKRTMTKSNDKQMFLMPYFFWKALGEKGEIFTENFVAELGLVNIFFWNAFIIYDDFWDEEGVPKKLPIANLFAREFTQFFSLVLEVESGFGKIFRETMNKLDEANTWETLYCRAEVSDNQLLIPQILPDYGDYTVAFEPASAHMFGSMVMLYRLGYGFNSGEIKNLVNYFKNYLIAMQINDDAHDWKDDIERGHLSTVVVMIIDEYLKIYPQEKRIDLRKIDILKEIYYQKVVRKMCRTVIKHTTKSRLALEELDFIENREYLERVIVLVEEVAQNTLAEQREISSFLKGFNSG